MPLGGNGSVQKVLWEGPAPKTPSFVNYAHRSEGSFSVDVRDAATGAWKSSLGGYIATSGETHVVLIGRDKIDYLSGFQSDFHRLQSSDASNLIYGAYHEVSDMLSCVDAGFALARMEEQNRIP